MKALARFLIMVAVSALAWYLLAHSGWNHGGATCMSPAGWNPC